MSLGKSSITLGEAFHVGGRQSSAEPNHWEVEGTHLRQELTCRSERREAAALQRHRLRKVLAFLRGRTKRRASQVLNCSRCLYYVFCSHGLPRTCPSAHENARVVHHCVALCWSAWRDGGLMIPVHRIYFCITPFWPVWFTSIHASRVPTLIIEVLLETLEWKSGKQKNQKWGRRIESAAILLPLFLKCFCAVFVTFLPRLYVGGLAIEKRAWGGSCWVSTGPLFKYRGLPVSPTSKLTMWRYFEL